jgi:hypothetical protein
MKKKTKRRFKRAIKQLRAAFPTTRSVGPAAAVVGVLSAGGLLSVIARDRVVREHCVSLVRTMVDRVVGGRGPATAGEVLDGEEFANVGGQPWSERSKPEPAQSPQT